MKIGIDGGGTKTELILVDAQGEVRSQLLAPGCNPNVVGTDHARRIVTDAMVALLDQASVSPRAITHTLLCMAGSPIFWQEFARELHEFGQTSTVDDSIPVLELATAGEPGLVLHGGTGSFVAARGPDGRVHYAGGLGWRLGDPGSGYDLGRRALSRGLLELQGWQPPSRLSGILRDQFGLDDAKTTTRQLYAQPEPNRAIAGLAPAVLHLAKEGDTTAVQLILESAGELLELAVRVAQRLFPQSPLDTIPAGLSGPVLTHPVVIAQLAPRSPLPLTPVTAPPIEGVRRLLSRL
jgi:glucosamine kinase